MEDYRAGFYIGRTRLEIDRLDLEKDFEADYWVYTDCSTIVRSTVWTVS